MRHQRASTVSAKSESARGAPDEQPAGAAAIPAAYWQHYGIVQRIESGDAASDEPMHAAAQRGIAGGGGRLPHFDQIQRAFGRHDVSGVQAHVGGAARDASKSIGARAYATDGHVAFRETPDLHTAAHEAAHVVQQRAGVQLKGDTGERGDAYERHADAVAERVVQGRSAEALLDEKAGGALGGGGALQLISDEEVEQVISYLETCRNQLDFDVSDIKLREIANSSEVKSIKKLKDAKAKARAMLEALKPKTQPLPLPPQDDPEEDVPNTTKQTQSQPPSEKKEKKKKEKKVYSLGEVGEKFKDEAKPLDYLGVVQNNNNLPPPITTTTQEDRSSPIISKIRSWYPSQGHSGCRAMNLTTDDLQKIVDWALNENTKYFVKKGRGTGEYSERNQLKVIHKQVKAGGKNATYHITVRQEQLDGVGVEESDE